MGIHKRLLVVVIPLLFMSVASMAQSAEELAAAKEIARQYGYSEGEINAVLNHQISTGAKQTSTTAAPQVARTTTVAAGGVTEAGTKENVEVVVDTIVDNTTVAAPVSGIYGHDIFKTANLNFVPSYNIPTPENYKLAPGDELIIDIWGKAFTNITQIISPEGSITITGIGPVYLTGQTIKEAEKSLKSYLSKIYSGINLQTPDTYMKLSLGRIRSFTINVLGDVAKPGTYTIPSLSTIASAMYLAGGVTNLGSIRQIKLYRVNKLIKVFDVYEFILNGDFSSNVRLEDNDLLKVDPYVNLVSITGNVKRAMRYELLDGETIASLLKYCGGFTGDAYTDKVLVTRNKGVQRESFDVSSKDFAKFKLQDGDQIAVSSNLNEMKNRVAISGPVYYPGSYSISDTLSTLKRLVEVAGGLKEETYMIKGLVIRTAENKEPMMLSFSPKKIMSGEESIDLMKEDQVRFYTIQQLKDRSTVSINGSVNNPTNIEYRDGIMLSDMILLANGPTKEAFMDNAVIARYDENRDPITLTFSLGDVLSGKTDIQMMEDDQITIFSKRAMRDQSTITINGAVNNPTTFTYREGLTLSEAILMANGFTEGATMAKIEVARRNLNINSLTPSDTVAQLFELNLVERPQDITFVLMPYDMVMVRRAPDYLPQQSVTISGEVVFPGSHVVEKNEVRVSDIVKKAGGFKKEAYISGSKISRQLTQEEYQRVMTAIDIARKQMGANDTLNIEQIAVGDRYDIGLDMDAVLAEPGSYADVVLCTGDIIYVPKMNNTVKISGGVLFPNVVAYNPNFGWKKYIEMAGGFVKQARKCKTYVVHMNNTVSTGHSGRKVLPGSEIIVPQKQENERRQVSAAEIMAIATSTTSIATMALTIANMYK